MHADDHRRNTSRPWGSSRRRGCVKPHPSDETRRETSECGRRDHQAESCLSGPVQPGFTDSGLSSPHAFDDWSVLVFHPWIVISAVRLVAALLFVVGLLSPSMAQQTERRIALVIGNSSYSEGPLSAPANDAGLVAQTLQAAGFDVVGARDLDGESLRRAIRDFVDKAGQSGPDTVATVYFAGYGLQ